MAKNGWIMQASVAAGLAAAIGAAQLGIGYGLGIVVWTDAGWLSSLAWATWIAASSTVLGAVLAAGLASRLTMATAETTPVRISTSTRFPMQGGGPWRLTLAAAAAVGALVTPVLVAVPARDSVRVAALAPASVAAGYALIGVLLGQIIGYWAVVSRPVAANVIGTTIWLWALALVVIGHDLWSHRPSRPYLTAWQFAGPDVRHGVIFWPGSLLTLTAALLIGMAAAWPSVRRGDHGIGAAAAGAVGPLLVAAAYFALAPRLDVPAGPLQSAYLTAPYAVLAGLGGSALAVALGRRLAARAPRSHPRRSSITLPRHRPAQSTEQPAHLAESAASTATPPAASTTPPAASTTPPAASTAAPAKLARTRAPRKKADPAVSEPTPGRATVARPPTDPPVARINPQDRR